MERKRKGSDRERESVREGERDSEGRVRGLGRGLLPLYLTSG